MEYHPGTDSNTVTNGNKSDKPWFKHPYTLHKPSNLSSLKYLTQQQIDEFRNDGYLLVPGKQYWTEQELNDIIAGTNLMDDWPDKAGYYMKYYEKAKTTASDKVDQNNYVASDNDKKQLQRIENFCQYNQQLDSVLRGDKMLQSCSELFGEQAILYKEKVNYKLPNAEGM